MRYEIKHYEEESFEDEMTEYLMDHENKKSPYIDIDSVDGKNPLCPSYYEDLSLFLQISLQSKDKNTMVIAPEKQSDKEYVDDRKIAMIKNSQPFLLTSDTFGFSGGGETVICSDPKMNNKGYYPYGSLFELSRGINVNEKKKICSFISKCINDTRTLGGAFVWPVNMIWNNEKWKGSSRTSQYNFRRGTGCYIEDRVDLTLLEIYHYVDKKSKTDYFNIWKEDILKACLNSQDIWLEDWLDSFDSFKEYVELLMFHPFVVNIDDKSDYLPIDIINSKISKIEEGDGFSLIGEIQWINDSNKKIGWGIKGIVSDENMEDEKKIERLKQMLTNVRLLTLARSKMMEMVIHKNGNPWEKTEIPQWEKVNGEWKFVFPGKGSSVKGKGESAT